jgi:fumarate hydratase class II
MNYRIEEDTMGRVRVPADKYWGAQTQRSLMNFPIGPAASMPIEIIHAFGYLKKAAAVANNKFGLLSDYKMKIIARVCDEITAGKLDDNFPLVIWQTGSGTHTNMNCNEVIANRAHVLLGNKSGSGERFIHPIDDVNKSQSSNDTFASAMHIAAYKKIVEYTIPEIEGLSAAFSVKSAAMAGIVKTGRTHLMDATPLTLGQELSGYVSQLNHGIKALKNTLPHLSELAIGGTAVGTGLNTPEGYDKEVTAIIARLTNLPFISAENKFESLAANDAIVETHGSIKQLAVSLMKIANDIRILASGPRSGIGEITIPSNEPGSSIMPGKVNPTQTEAMTMVCAQIMGNDTTITHRRLGWPSRA